MDESYNASLTLWPAGSLPASVAHQLQAVGVDLSAHEVNDGSLTARRTRQGTVVLALAFDDRRYGLTDLEAVLATLRIARISYVAWDAKKGEIAGTARAFDPSSGIERQFTVTADGEPVLTASDLRQFEGDYGTAEALLEGIRRWLRLPTPEDLSDLALQALSIEVISDEQDDARGALPVAETSGCCSSLARVGDR